MSAQVQVSLYDFSPHKVYKSLILNSLNISKIIKDTLKCVMIEGLCTDRTLVKSGV